MSIEESFEEEDGVLWITTLKRFKNNIVVEEFKAQTKLNPETYITIFYPDGTREEYIKGDKDRLVYRTDGTHALIYNNTSLSVEEYDSLNRLLKTSYVSHHYLEGGFEAYLKNICEYDYSGGTPIETSYSLFCDPSGNIIYRLSGFKMAYRCYLYARFDSTNDVWYLPLTLLDGTDVTLYSDMLPLYKEAYQEKR